MAKLTTNIILDVLARRYASPALPEVERAQSRRFAAQLRAKNRLRRRAASRRLQLVAVAADEEQTTAHALPRLPLMEQGFVTGREVVDVAMELGSPHYPLHPGLTLYQHGEVASPSYAQLAAADINLSSITNPNPDKTSEGCPTLAQLSMALLSPSSGGIVDEPVQSGFPSYAHFAALRNLNPVVPTQDIPSPGFPFHAQLNAALKKIVTGYSAAGGSR
ncbi:hypothetical protein GN244_ATG13090 [Phytophthora infestans]|uniref:Uncharacterized protein n=1 Tax=Phytophthora infestans TaxID=4787 RepID=A0A833SYN6_PHYIN|nr:hypothetical protein GN244_ATG13090 [Phytophthora infestans]